MFTKESLVKSLSLRIARAAICVDAISARYSLGNHTSRVDLLIIITSTAIDRIERRSTSVDGIPRPRVANSRSHTENYSSSNYNQDDSPSVVCSTTTLEGRGRRDAMTSSRHTMAFVASNRVVAVFTPRPSRARAHSRAHARVARCSASIYGASHGGEGLWVTRARARTRTLSFKKARVVT